MICFEGEHQFIRCYTFFYLFTYLFKFCSNKTLTVATIIHLLTTFRETNQRKVNPQE